jgi:hypothetical protein
VTRLSPKRSRGEGDIGWRGDESQRRVGENINEGRERAQVGEATDKPLVGEEIKRTKRERERERERETAEEEVRRERDVG